MGGVFVLKKSTFVMGMLCILALAAGCVDLFSVPGIAISPDGERIVFLSPGESLSFEDAASGEANDDATFDLIQADLATGERTTIAAGDDETLITSFDVNPTNGDVVYLTTSEAGGTSLQLYGSDGSTRELLASSAFPGISIGTMLAFSPDGDKLAFTVLQLPPEVTPDDIQSDEDGLTPEQAKAVKFVAYVLDIGSGTLTPISNPDMERANTVAWSPSSNRVAYNAWFDANGDGVIATTPSLSFGNADTGGSDLSRISVYDLGTGTTTPIDEPTLNFAPAFLTDDKLAYLSGDFASTAPPAIKVYAIPTGESSLAYQPMATAPIAMSVSPNGERVAWIEFADGSNETEPGVLYVSGSDFAEPRAVATLPVEIQFADPPIWTPDGNSVLISVTNFLAIIPQKISVSFSTSGESSAETEGGTTPQVIQVDVDSGEINTVYSGSMINSSFFSGLFGVVTSGSLNNMFGGGSGE
jgi:hypothetical protein